MSTDILHREYAGLISQLPWLFLLKSCESRYFAFSPQFSSLLGWKNQKDCINKSDEDLPCRASEMSEIFVQEDKNIFLKGETRQLHVTKYCDENIYYQKESALSASGEKLGIIVYDEDVKNNQAIQHIIMNDIVRYSSKKSKSRFSVNESELNGTKY